MPKTLKEACELSIKKWEKINSTLEYIKEDSIDIEEELFEVTQPCGLCEFDLNKKNYARRCTECPLWEKGLRCYEREPYKSIYKRVDRLKNEGSLGAFSFLDDEEQMQQLREDVVLYGEELIEELNKIVADIKERKE